MKKFHITIGTAVIGFLLLAGVRAGDISPATQACLDCHADLMPGLVEDWYHSRHARMTPAEALLLPEIERRVSISDSPGYLTGTVVGCAECHTLLPGEHEDTFEHFDYPVHAVVSPNDCAVCHPAEWEQYSKNIMSFANINLTQNDLYQTMVNEINGLPELIDNQLTTGESDPLTDMSSCLSCHGTEIRVTGTAKRETDLGTLEFPVLEGWPNQGVGRINPDGSFGACTACHTRHVFSIETARKPYTCAQCHKGPDVPAYPVYQVSKHGNVFFSQNSHWDFEPVPWTAGRDFAAPTCAVCHISLVTDKDGTIISERTHRMNDRLPQRLFGLIYSHPHPATPNTSIITNKAGFPLPTELTGEPVEEFLIDRKEQEKRLHNMQKVCRACHSTTWTEGHFAALDRAVETTNEMTWQATDLMTTIWTEGLALGLPQGSIIFDEAIEKQWTEQWLFYVNSTRFAAAMMGADYGVFANGRWYMAKNVREMRDWLELHNRLKK
nr:hydroxylamine oxidase [candidate division Zixibacteria bacterium]